MRNGACVTDGYRLEGGAANTDSSKGLRGDFNLDHDTGTTSLIKTPHVIYNRFCDEVSSATSSESLARRNRFFRNKRSRELEGIERDEPMEEEAADGARGGSGNGNGNGSGNGSVENTGQC